MFNEEKCVPTLEWNQRIWYANRNTYIRKVNDQLLKCKG
jgi:hypothetical protein